MNTDLLVHSLTSETLFPLVWLLVIKSDTDSSSFPFACAVRHSRFWPTTAAKTTLVQDAPTTSWQQHFYCSKRREKDAPKTKRLSKTSGFFNRNGFPCYYVFWQHTVTHCSCKMFLQTMSTLEIIKCLQASKDYQNIKFFISTRPLIHPWRSAIMSTAERGGYVGLAH